ncbi:MAG: hypothetical protein LBS55_06530 [Prevotellaceae bacterium]|jgi:hypothetical protein|nr:hypothetical protein [Prevotellaceae bacterium]
MVLTIHTLFNDPNIIKSVIDRVLATRLDVIFWKRYLDFEETRSRVFKTYIGTVTGVTAGSVIDRNSNKPIRQRKSLGSGYGEVAYLGDSYQMDNDRLDMLRSLIDKFNDAKTADQVRAMNDIIAYITDDLRQVLLAPHKRMDIVLGELRSTGKASVKMADNPEGIELLDMEMPVKLITPAAGDKADFISYLKKQIEGLRTTIGNFSVMEMNRSTFNTNIVGSSEFQSTYKMIFSNAQFATAAGLITEAMTNQVFSGIGLPPIRIIDDLVAKEDGTNVQVFKDNRIALLTQDKIGKMMWHTPYEITDPIPNKVYTRSEGGMYISNQRTEEGRFMEYGAEWIPNIISPNRIAIFDLDTMNA